MAYTHCYWLDFFMAKFGIIGEGGEDGERGFTEAPKAGSANEARKWNTVVQKTSKWRDTIADKQNWKRYVAEYKGDWSSVQSSVDIGLMPINLVFAFVKTEIARLYFRNPWISVNPKKMEDFLFARIAEKVLNHYWGELDLKREIKRALLDCLLVGHGWIKLGYTAEFGTIESQIAESERRKKGKGKGVEVEVNEYVKSENVFAYYVPWDRVTFSADSLKPPYDSRWLCFEAVKPIRAVKESGIYKNIGDLRPVKWMDQKIDKDEMRPEVEGVKLREIWDKENHRVITVSPGCDKFLREVEWPYEMEGYPAVMFGFNPSPDEAYPISDVAPWEAQTIEQTKMMAIMLNHLKRWNRQIFMKSGFMTDEEKEKFKLGIDGAIIETQGSPTDFFLPPYAPVQQDIYGTWQILGDISRNVSGQTEVERGGAAKTPTRTLGELRLAMQGSRTRADEKVDVLESSIEEVARKLLSLLQQHMTLPKLIRIVGPQTLQQEEMKERPSAQQGGMDSFTSKWGFTATADDIQGNFDVSVVAGSTLPMNKESKLEVMQKMLENAEAIGIMPGSKAARELGREMLREVGFETMQRIMDLADEDAKGREQAQSQMMQAKMKLEQGDQQIQAAQVQGDAQARARTHQLNVQKAQEDAKLEKAKLQLDLIRIMKPSGNGGGAPHGA